MISIHQRTRLFALLIGVGVAGVLVVASVSATAPGSNGLIAFQRFAGPTEGNASSQLFTLDPGGSTRQLTHVKGGAFHPAWSPDGARVVFEVGLFGPHTPTRLYTINADGTGLHRLTTACGGRCADLMGSYSPDGKRIAFDRIYGPIVRRHYGRRGRITLEFASHTDLMVVAAGGGRPTRVKRYGVDPQPWNGAPQWSPDGKSLVLPLGSGKHPGSAQRLGTALHVVSVNGRSQRRISPWGLGAASPSWSPDGSLIAFHSEGGHTPNLYVVQPNGTGLRQLLAASQSGFPQDPAWSPDGAQIAFDFGGFGDAQRGIYAINANGSNMHALVDTPQMEVAPAWAAAH